ACEIPASDSSPLASDRTSSKTRSVVCVQRIWRHRHRRNIPARGSRFGDRMCAQGLVGPNRQKLRRAAGQDKFDAVPRVRRYCDARDLHWRIRNRGARSTSEKPRWLRGWVAGCGIRISALVAPSEKALTTKDNKVHEGK